MQLFSNSSYDVGVPDKLECDLILVCDALPLKRKLPCKSIVLTFLIFLLKFVFCRVRKIKDHDSDFSSKEFAVQAQEMFIEAHMSLAQ